MVVGLIILAGAVTVMAKISFSGIENVRSIRLNQQMRSAMDFIHRDLQRAGYVNTWDAAVVASGTPLATVYNGAALIVMSDIGVIGLDDTQSGTPTPTSEHTCADSNTDTVLECPCITYRYDKDEDGEIDAEEVYGIRLHEGAIETSTSADCTAGSWDDISDDNIYITKLTFELDPNSFVWEIEGDGVDLDADGIADCQTGETCFARRKINVVMEGRLTSDDAITISLRDEIKIKNDHYYTMP